MPAGESLTVPRGAVHGFRNSGETPVRFINVHSLALAFQDHLEILDRLVRTGKFKNTKNPRSLNYMSISAAEYRPDVTLKPPPWVTRGLTFIGRRIGYTLD